MVVYAPFSKLFGREFLGEAAHFLEAVVVRAFAEVEFDSEMKPYWNIVHRIAAPRYAP